MNDEEISGVAPLMVVPALNEREVIRYGQYSGSSVHVRPTVT